MACTDCDDKDRTPTSETEGEGTPQPGDGGLGELFDHAEVHGAPEA